MRAAAGSGCREQALFNSMQAFPRGLGEYRVGANNLADHLPGREVERALRCGTHGQRNGALRAETDALGGRFLARPHARRLCEQVHRNRFLPGLEFSTTAKTIQVVQRCGLRFVRNGFTILSPRRSRWRKYAEGFPACTGEPRFALVRSGSHRALYCYAG